MATLKSRIQEASTILKIASVSFENIGICLKEILEKMGIDDTDIGLQVLDSDTTTFEMFNDEFQKANIVLDSNLSMPLKDKVPVARLRFAWENLKGKGAQTGKGTKKEYSLEELRPIGQWNDLELLEKYTKDCPIVIEDELAKRSKGRYTVIFNDDCSVDVENSLYMLRRARYQETPSTFSIKDEIKQVFRVGEYPLEIFYECPVHPHTLLVDGYCDECSKKWSIEEYDRNVLLRLVVESHEVADIRNYRSLDFNALAKEFPKTFIKYKELKEEGKLPSLKRKLSRNKSGDPFRVVESAHRTF